MVSPSRKSRAMGAGSASPMRRVVPGSTAFFMREHLAGGPGSLGGRLVRHAGNVPRAPPVGGQGVVVQELSVQVESVPVLHQ